MEIVRFLSVPCIWSKKIHGDSQRSIESGHGQSWVVFLFPKKHKRWWSGSNLRNVPSFRPRHEAPLGLFRHCACTRANTGEVGLQFWYFIKITISDDPVFPTVWAESLFGLKSKELLGQGSFAGNWVILVPLWLRGWSVMVFEVRGHQCFQFLLLACTQR